ncbi:MAG: DinB family protein [Actinomycetota bacterium]|nr:DinB family protein [Actinomycetota bacterium]
MAYDQIVPDDKDWTFVITEGCNQCSFQPYPARETSSRLAEATKYYEKALANPNVSLRPSEGIWSPLEYSCHVRDVLELFNERLTKMLTIDDAQFDNWDQDQNAIEKDYENQNPDEVLVELRKNSELLSMAFSQVEEDDWSKRGLRSNGSRFTVETFAIYLMHDIEHHIYDIENQLHLGR